MNKTIVLISFIITSYSEKLFAQAADRFAVVITEFFPDPSPSIGLPGGEFIELTNRSFVPIDLQNWKISDGSSIATITSHFILQPNSQVILCATSAAISYASYGKTIGVTGIPSLNNDADMILLYSPEGRIIHAVSYSDKWYQNELKAEGGWTLEMIDINNPCGADNWKASIHTLGGTPGKKNSVDAINIDTIPPALIRTYAIDSMKIVALFDEPLDSFTASHISNYQFNSFSAIIKSVLPLSPMYQEVEITLDSPLQKKSIYQLIVKNITDCQGNSIGFMNKANAGIPMTPNYFDIIINEILFNPVADGYDYIEVFNRSKAIVDCSKLYIANKNSSGSITNSRQLTSVPFLFYPGEYIVVSESGSWIRKQYLVKSPDQLLTLSALPSMPDDKGNIVLLNYQGQIIDALGYDQKWHFAILDNKEGVSLERLNYNDSSQLSSNWTSAASSAGFGTPTYQNSQFSAASGVKAQIQCDPNIFSPDNDGYDDFITVRVMLNEPGFSGSIAIYDLNGRRVKTLVKSATLSVSSVFRWDGLNDQQQMLPTGIYIIVTEIFNLKGETKKIKNVVTLAKRF